MIEIVIAIVVSVIASSGFWAFLQWSLNNKQEKRSAEKEALLALLHDRLYTELSEQLKKESIKKEDYENITYLYKPYIKLGGNSTCEKMYNDMKNKEIKP